MSLQIQEYLRKGGTLEELSTTLGITAKRHNKYNNLVLFKYNQIESPMANPIVQECRGIILDESDNWNVIFHGMNKFFNYGEGHAASIDWETVRFQEKVDGSLIGLYFYNGMWEVCTSGTPDASGYVNTSSKSFREYFLETLGNRFNQDEIGVNDFNYWLELTGPANRIVVPHQLSGVTLLGARNIHTGKEVHPSEVNHIFPGVMAVREFPLRTIEDMIATFSTISPLQQEGYVIVDANFNRIKCKHPGYVQLHHMKDTLASARALVEVARAGEISEVVATFPEYAPLLNDTKIKIDILVTELESDYEKIKDIPEQKAFALQALKSKCSPALFQIRSKKVSSIREYIRIANIDSVMSLLNKI